MKTVFTFLLLCGAAFSSCTGSSPTWTSTPDLSSLSTCVASASEGDTINVSAGSATWTGSSGITISGKGLKIQGAGAGRIVGYQYIPITGSPLGCNYNLTTGAICTITFTGTLNMTLSPTSACAQLGVTPCTNPFAQITTGETLYIYEFGFGPSTNISNPNFMEGTVTSFNSSTGALVMNITSSGGTCGQSSGGPKMDSNCLRWLVSTLPQTTIVNNLTGSPTPAFNITEDTSVNTTISGIQFTMGTNGTQHVNINRTNTNGKAVILHDNWMQQGGSGGYAMISTNSDRGLIYNTSFDTSPYQQSNYAVFQIKDDTNVMTTSWESISTMGTNDTASTSFCSTCLAGQNNFYFENNDVHGFQVWDNMDDNARAVIRYNILNASGNGSHGADTSNYGNRFYEFYDNIGVFAGYNSPYASCSCTWTPNLQYWNGMRGGTLVNHDNVLPAITSSDYGSKSDAQLIAGNLDRNGGPHPCWGEGTTGGADYYIPRQVGFGYVTGSGSTTGVQSTCANAPLNCTGNTFGPASLDSFTYVGDSEPIYIWNNARTIGGLKTALSIAITNSGLGQCTSSDLASNYIVSARDYNNTASTAKPSYTPYTYPHPLETTVIPNAGSAFHLCVLQSPGNISATFWSNTNGVTGLLQTSSNPYVYCATQQALDSDSDPMTLGTISVTHGSAAFSLTCSNTGDDSFDGCNALSSLTGILVKNSGTNLWYELSGSLSCSGLNCTGNFASVYTGTTNSSASFHGFNFSFFDSQVTPWTNAGKYVNIAGLEFVSFSSSSACQSLTGNSHNYAGNSSSAGNCGAPAKLWNLLSLGTSYTTCETGVGSGIFAYTPDWLNSTMYGYWQDSQNALVAHIAAVNGSKFSSLAGYMRLPPGHGGETLPSNTWSTSDSGANSTCVSFWQSVLGSTNTSTQTTNWVNNYLSPLFTWENSMRAAVISQYSWAPYIEVGVTPMGSPNTQLPNSATPLLVAQGLGFGSQGLESSDIGNVSGCTANWCDLFTTYRGQVTPLELQTIGQSCPTEGTGVTCTGNQGSTGPLPPLLAWAVSGFGGNTAVYTEIYYQDWLLAFSSTYCSTSTGGGGAGYTSAQCNQITPAYLAAIEGNVADWGTGAGSGTTTAQNCGPPGFGCANRSANLVNEPTIPSGLATGFSAASATAVSDSSLSTALINRCTDGYFVSSPSSLIGTSFSAGIGDSSEARVWSVSPSVGIHLGIVEDGGAEVEPFSLLSSQTTGPVCQRLYSEINSVLQPSGCTVQAGYSNNSNYGCGARWYLGQWSPTVWHWYYALNKSGNATLNPMAQLWLYDICVTVGSNCYNYPSVANPSQGPTETELVDFTHGFPAGYCNNSTCGTASILSYIEFAGVGNDSTTSTVAAADFSNATGGQDTGYLIVQAVFNPQSPCETNNTYYAYNLDSGSGTATAYETTYTGGTGTCPSGGTWTQTTLGSIPIVNPTGYSYSGYPSIHNVRINRSGKLVQISQGSLCNVSNCSTSHHYIPLYGSGLTGAGSLYVAPTTTGHEAQGWLGEDQNDSGNYVLYSNPLPSTFVPVSQLSPSSGLISYCGSDTNWPNLTSGMGSCYLPPDDNHQSWDPDDLTSNDTASWANCTTTSAIANGNSLTRPPPGQQAAVSGYANSAIGPWRDECLIGSNNNQRLNREWHTFDSGTNPISSQYVNGVISQDTQELMWTSDGQGSFGLDTTAGINACIAGSDYWRASWSYTNNVIVLLPSSSYNAAFGTTPGGYLMQAQNAGISGSTPPTVPQSAGSNVTDNTITWKSIGQYSCRTDVLVGATQ